MNWSERKKFFILKLQNGQYKQLWYLFKRRIQLSFIMRPIGIPIATLVIPFIYILRPFIRINFFSIPTGRLGHLVLEPEMYLRRKRLMNEGKKSIDLFFTNRSRQDNVVANKQILKMINRNCIVFDSYIASWIYYTIEWLLIYTNLRVELPHDENSETDKILKTVDSTFAFTKEELDIGVEKLRSMGIEPDKDWYVLIFARDSAYLSEAFPNYDWGYHDWRNADINSYKEATEYIIKHGGFVLRMGSIVNKDMGFSHPQYIDYAKEYRDEFMDVFLAATCKFMVGTNAGLADMVLAFDRPRAIVNVIPLGYVPHGRDNLYIPKKYINKVTREYMSMDFVLKNHRDTIYDQELFLGDDYDYVDNTSKEIFEITKEMYARLSGDFVLSEKQKVLMQKYQGQFSKENASYGIGNTIGMNFLENNADWIINESPDSLE